jgi:hypothetical protein
VVPRAQARAKFPNATVRSAGLDDIAQSLMRPEVRSQLPVLDLEVGDTWSYGIQSDPRKVANVRAATRHRAAFETAQKQQAGGLSVLSSPNPFTWWSNFSRCLLKGFEHTWGLRYDMCYGGGFESSDSLDKLEVGETSSTAGDPDNPNSFPYNDIPGGMYNSSGYMNEAFHAARQDPDGYPARHCEPSWADQTNWAVKWANEAIEDTTLRSTIEAEVAMLSNVVAPSLEGFAAADIKKAGASFDLGGTTLTFCPVCGAIIGMMDKRGVVWASPNNPMALFE